MKLNLLLFWSGMLIGVVAAFMLWLLLVDFTINQKAVDAIAECQSKLPRDQHCEYVITARVKEVE